MLCYGENHQSLGNKRKNKIKKEGFYLKLANNLNVDVNLHKKQIL